MINQNNLKKIIFDYTFIAIGSVIMSLGLIMFLVPLKIAPGGVSGLGVVLYHLFKFPIGVSMLIMNIPLFFLGIKEFGTKFGPRTFFSFSLVSITTDFFDKVMHVEAATSDPLLASIFGGIILGLGLGIVFKFKGTTGGSDIVGQLINKHTNMSVGTGIMSVDFFIISIAGIAFQNINLALYGFISLYFSSKIIDVVIDGFDYARGFYIISEKQDEIMRAINKKMDRSGTVLSGKGIYSGTKRDILFAVVTRKEDAKLKEIVKNIDPLAFVVIANIHEVVGNGFRTRY